MDGTSKYITQVIVIEEPVRADHCTGKYNAKLCDESKSIKVNAEGVWKDISLMVLDIKNGTLVRK